MTVLKELEVKKIIIGKQGEESKNYTELLKISQEKLIPIVVVKKGDAINVEKNLKINILFPTNKLIQNNILNNNSIVSMLIYKEFKMLFTGDIEEIAEKELLKLYSSGELKADILKVPHHRIKNIFK